MKMDNITVGKIEQLTTEGEMRRTLEEISDRIKSNKDHSVLLQGAMSVVGS